MAAFVAQFQFLILCIFSGLLGVTALAAFGLALFRSGVWARLRKVCADRTECGPCQGRISFPLIWLCVVPLVCVLVVRGSTKNSGGTNDPPGRMGRQTQTVPVAPFTESSYSLDFMISGISLSTDAIHSGYFDNALWQPYWYHSDKVGAGEWIPGGFHPNDDVAFELSCPQPWSSGVLIWYIPLAWRPQGDATVAGTVFDNITQEFSITSDGVFVLKKW